MLSSTTTTLLLSILLTTPFTSALPQQSPAPSAALYTITAATIKQAGWTSSTNPTIPLNQTQPQPPSKKSRLRRQQQQQPQAPPASPVVTPPSSTASALPSASASSLFDPSRGLFPPDDSSASSPGSDSDVASPNYDTATENFTLTLVTAAAPNVPITCNLTWNAGEANGAPDSVSKNFTCSSSSSSSSSNGQQQAQSSSAASVWMQRRNVTPVYGFYIFVQAGQAPVAAWMVKGLRQSPGWTVSPGLDVFAGQAALTGVPTQSLADFLAGQ